MPVMDIIGGASPVGITVAIVDWFLSNSNDVEPKTMEEILIELDRLIRAGALPQAGEEGTFGALETQEHDINSIEEIREILDKAAYELENPPNSTVDISTPDPENTSGTYSDDGQSVSTDENGNVFDIIAPVLGTIGGTGSDDSTPSTTPTGTQTAIPGATDPGKSSSTTGTSQPPLVPAVVNPAGAPAEEDKITVILNAFLGGFGTMLGGIFGGLANQGVNNLLGTSPTDLTQDAFNQLFPGTNPWERLGAAGSTAGGASQAAINERMQIRQLATQERIAAVQAGATIGSANIGQTGPKAAAETGLAKQRTLTEAQNTAIQTFEKQLRPELLRAEINQKIASNIRSLWYNTVTGNSGIRALNDFTKFLGGVPGISREFITNITTDYAHMFSDQNIGEKIRVATNYTIDNVFQREQAVMEATKNLLRSGIR